MTGGGSFRIAMDSRPYGSCIRAGRRPHAQSGDAIHERATAVKGNQVRAYPCREAARLAMTGPRGVLQLTPEGTGRHGAARESEARPGSRAIAQPQTAHFVVARSQVAQA